MTVHSPKHVIYLERVEVEANTAVDRPSFEAWVARCTCGWTAPVGSTGQESAREIGTSHAWDVVEEA